MTLRKITCIFAPAALTLALLAALPAQAQNKLQIAGNFAGEHPSSVAVEQVFKKEIARLTGNQLQVDVFPAMQLGGAKENVDAVRSGTLALTWVGAAYLSRIVPELEAVALPSVFPNREVALRVIDGPVGDAIDKKLQDKGFVALGWMELGMRHITNSRGPITSVADLRGLKLRLQPSETHLASFRALGANPVAMDVKELYSALGQRVVDAQENPYTVISASRYGEVQKHLSNSGQFFDFIAVIGSKKALDQLEPEHQGSERGHGSHHRLPAQAGHRVRDQGAGRAEDQDDLHRDHAGRARGNAQGHRAGDRRGGQEARRCGPGRSGAGRSRQALSLAIERS